MDCRFIISSCLLGETCKYNGGHNLNKKILAFAKENQVLSVCPEMLGGLPCPRACCEIKDQSVIDKDGNDVSKQFLLGAEIALEKVQQFGATIAILQPRSPSCGCGKVYSGNFDGTLIDGDGCFTKKLKEAEIKVLSADKFDQFLESSIKILDC